MPRGQPLQPAVGDALLRDVSAAPGAGSPRAATKASSRRAARSRAASAPSSPNRRTRGLNGPPPTISPAASPRHSTAPSGTEREGVVGLGGELAQPPRDLRRDGALGGAAQRLVLERAWRRAPARNGAPVSRPTKWPSTVTAPSARDAAEHGPARWSSERISALVRRSMKRCISFSCRVSESRSSSARARPCQCCRDRPASRPVGDVGERAHAGEARRQRVDVAVGAVERWRTGPASSPRARAGRPASDARTGRRSGGCARPGVVLRKSGVWQASHSRIRLARSRRAAR